MMIKKSSQATLHVNSACHISYSAISTHFRTITAACQCLHGPYIIHPHSCLWYWVCIMLSAWRSFESCGRTSVQNSVTHTTTRMHTRTHKVNKMDTRTPVNVKRLIKYERYETALRSSLTEVINKGLWKGWRGQKLTVRRLTVLRITKCPLGVCMFFNE